MKKYGTGKILPDGDEAPVEPPSGDAEDKPSKDESDGS